MQMLSISGSRFHHPVAEVSDAVMHLTSEICMSWGG